MKASSELRLSHSRRLEVRKGTQANCRQRGWNDMSGRWRPACFLSSTTLHLQPPSGKKSQRSWIYDEQERRDPLTVRFAGNHRIYILWSMESIPLGALMAITT